MEELNEFELMERCGRARAAEMHRMIHQRLALDDSSAQTTFSAIGPPGRVSRKHAAAQFHALLVLKKQSIVNVTQMEPFADIFISRGQDFSRND